MSIINTHQKYVNGNLVFYNSTRLDKWIDAYGPTVRKYFEDFIGPTAIGVDNADPMGWIVTPIAGDAGDSAITAGNEAGGAIVLTTDDTENDGINITWNNEAFTLAAGDPTYFGVRLKVAAADAVDLFAGMFITDTTIATAVTDGIYFKVADGAATCTGICEFNSAPSTAVSSGTFVNNTYSVLEFYYDGAGTVRMYFDDTLIETVSTATYIPIDEPLTFGLELLAGSTGAKTCTIDWIRCIQCQ